MIWILFSLLESKPGLTLKHFMMIILMSISYQPIFMVFVRYQMVQFKKNSIYSALNRRY